MVKRNPHLLLDELKLWLSQAVLRQADLTTIREKSLSNLLRWEAQGSWGPVYDEWRNLMTHASDAHLIKLMTSEDAEPTRLRQSIPYVGLVDEKTRLALIAKYETARVANDMGTDLEGGA